MTCNVVQYTVGSKEVADPYWANVVLLMHMEGANGAKTFTDVKGHPVTVYGEVTNDAANSKFGTSSAKHIGNLSWLELTNHEDFNFASGNFTIEGFMRITGTETQGGTLVSRWGSGPSTGTDWLVTVDTAGRVMFSAGSFTVVTTATLPFDGTWHHVAAERNGNTVTVFIDGTPRATGTISGVIGYTASQPLRTSRWNSSQSGIKGNIDELRITRAARYKGGAFSLPTAAYPEF